MINPSLGNLSLSSEKLKKLLAEERGIKSYKSISEDELLSALILWKPVKKSKKPKINLSKARIEKVRNEFNVSRHTFSKSKIKEIRRNLYEIKNRGESFCSTHGKDRKKP